jgi:hypothetical protein
MPRPGTGLQPGGWETLVYWIGANHLTQQTWDLHLATELKPATQYDDILYVLNQSDIQHNNPKILLVYTIIQSVADYCIQWCSYNYTWRRKFQEQKCYSQIKISH